MPRTEVTGRQIKDQSVDLAVDATGVLPVANGGSGASTLTLNAVLLGNGSGSLQTVAPGTSGNVLTSNGTTWVSAAPTGGGGTSRSVTVVSGPVTLGATASVDYVAALGSGAVVTLPSAVGNTCRYTIKNTTTSSVSVSTTSSQTVDGGPLVLGAWESVDLVSDGTNWMVV